MKVYVDENAKYKDVRSTGITFTLFGIIGLAAVALVWFNIIPVSLAPSSKYLITIVMGLMFLIFFIIGIRSFMSLSSIQKNADQKSLRENDILTWFLGLEDPLKGLVFEEDSTEEEKYLQKYEHLVNLVQGYDNSLSEEDCDHIVETLILTINGEK